MRGWWQRLTGKGDGTPPMPRLLSLLTPEEAASIGGLPPVAVAGMLEGESSAPQDVRINPAFADFLHQVLATAGARDPGTREAAARQGNGYIYIIDLRTPEGPGGNVPFSDIIGGFEVKDGVLGAWWRNPEHSVYTADGLVTLTPAFRAAFVEAVRALQGEPGKI